MDFLTTQMSGKDLGVLQRLVAQCARKNMVVIEVGSYTGSSALAMLGTIKQNAGRMFCIDWFKGNEGVSSDDYDDADALHPSNINTTYATQSILATLQHNIKAAGFEDLVSILIGTSVSIGPLVSTGVADLIFIDADHRYSAVKKDIETWYPKVRPGGILCGHDFEKPLQQCDLARAILYCQQDTADDCHYGVIRAVCERFPNVSHDGCIWYVRKPYPPATLAAAKARQMAGKLARYFRRKLG